MSTRKKIVIVLILGTIIPTPLSVVCANLLIMFGFWYFAAWGLRAWWRSKKLERRLRAEIRRGKVTQNDTTVDGGIIYPENYYRDELKLSRYS